jgi:hypothetical protein
VGDSEGGFWTGYDEKSVGSVVGMTGGVGCDGRTGNVHLDCVPTGVANLDKVVLVHPGLQVTKEEGNILWEVSWSMILIRGRVGDEAVAGLPLMVVLVLVLVRPGLGSSVDVGRPKAEASCAGMVSWITSGEWRAEFAPDWANGATPQSATS